MTSTHRNPVRWLAPVALVVCALAVLLVVTGSNSGGGGGSSSKTEQRSTGTSSKRSTAKRASRKARRAYRVRAGDTLGGIAQRTGVPLSELQALNPQLDAQALQTGQKVKLRP